MTEEDLRKKVEDSAKVSDEAHVDFSKETATFPFRWTSPRGEVFEGTFTNRILTLGELSRAATTVAQLNGGLPYEAMPPIHRDLNDRLGHLMVSLDIEERPEWGRNLLGIRHPDIIYALYRVVETHEATFRGQLAPEKGGSSDGNSPGA